MKSQVIASFDVPTWSEAIQRTGQGDVYFSSDYHLLSERNGEGTARAFVATAGADVLIHPFLLRPIRRVGQETVNGSWYDIETVYGYSGPLCTTVNPGFLAAAWAAFHDWCHEAGVVAEFVRFHPLRENQRYADPAMIVIPDRATVLVDLTGTPEDVWQRYPSLERNMVRKAAGRGLGCTSATFATGLQVFQKLYHATMARVGAAEYYRFAATYFETLQDTLGDNVRLFLVDKEEAVVAAALILLGDEGIHYHLAGSDPAHQQDAPMNLLLHTVALWGQEQGFSWLHLGGGRTPDPDDSLLHFKSTFSRRRLSFRTGRRVHLPEQYESLCARWMRQAGRTERPPYFLLYRLD